MHETLVTSEEMIRANEIGNFYKIKLDSRILIMKIIFKRRN